MTALVGRVAVVTGASSGIGRAISLALAQAGAELCLAARSLERLAPVADAVRAMGAGATIHEVDLSVVSDIERLDASIRRSHSGVDILIHSAGTITLGSVAEGRVEDFDRQYRTNVRGPYVLTQRLLPCIVSRRGHIVFINSSAGVIARAGVGQYAATKHALKAIADSLREELRESGVRVLSIFPGRTATPMQAALHDPGGPLPDPSRQIDPNDLATLVVTTLGLRSAEVKEIDVRPAGQ